MKKAVVITAVLALLAGVGGAIWLTTHQTEQNAVRAAQEQPQSTPEPSKYDVGPPDPQELLELVNEERKRIGVPPLQYDASVAKAAQLKADHMVANGYFDHIIPGTGYTAGPEMTKALDLSCKRDGGRENLYQWRGSDPATSRMAFDGWMSSDGHRSAIQDLRVTRTGFGVASDKTVVQLFCVNR